MAFDLPRETVVPVVAVEVSLDPRPHPFEQQFATEIEANWGDEIAVNPSLYDGRLMLHADLALEGGRLVGRCHEVRFATLMYWRKHRGSQSAEHAYAHAALVSRDNALIAIRMGDQTASPGAVYFAAGSFEPVDFVDGRVDVDGNMIREVGEETGLDIAALKRDPLYHLYSRAGGTVIVRRYFLDDDAEMVARRIEAYVDDQVEPEIAGPVIIRSADTLPDGIVPHMVAIVKWHFGKG